MLTILLERFNLYMQYTALHTLIARRNALVHRHSLLRARQLESNTSEYWRLYNRVIKLDSQTKMIQARVSAKIILIHTLQRDLYQLQHLSQRSVLSTKHYYTWPGLASLSALLTALPIIASAAMVDIMTMPIALAYGILITALAFFLSPRYRHLYLVVQVIIVTIVWVMNHG